MSVSPPTRAIPDNLADLIGNTPLVRLTRVAPDCGAELIAKLAGKLGVERVVAGRVVLHVADELVILTTTVGRAAEVSGRITKETVAPSLKAFLGSRARGVVQDSNADLLYKIAGVVRVADQAASRARNARVMLGIELPAAGLI